MEYNTIAVDRKMKKMISNNSQKSGFTEALSVYGFFTIMKKRFFDVKDYPLLYYNARNIPCNKTNFSITLDICCILYSVCKIIINKII